VKFEARNGQRFSSVNRRKLLILIPEAQKSILSAHFKPLCQNMCVARSIARSAVALRTSERDPFGSLKHDGPEN